jgi:hypothetical protein
MLTSPAREGSVLDAWAPLEVAKFEAAMCLVGKQFALIAKVRARARGARARACAALDCACSRAPSPPPPPGTRHKGD